MIDFEAILEKNNEVKRRKAAWLDLKERATNTSVQISDMPKGGGDGKRMERDVAGTVDAERDYLRAYEELKAMRRELSAILPVLKKWQHRDAIRKRYIEGKSIHRVMQEMGYEWAQTNRYMAEARKIIREASKNDIE